MTFSFLLSGAASADAYLVYYATFNGKTGHVGIAIDKYRILIKTDGEGHETEDTVATGELLYYDLWPREDQFDLLSTGRDLPAEYFRLPVSSMEEITLNSLYDKGIPHKEHYPCDGILRISTTWQEDDALRGYIDSLIGVNRPFNARNFNCTDFVIGALEFLWKEDLKADEYVFFGRTSTPNALYRLLRKRDGIAVIKNGDEKAGGSFISERVFN